MATYAQRWTSICDAIVNGTATDNQKLRLGRALAAKDGLLEEFDQGTNAQKVQMAVLALRRQAVAVVKNFEGTDASTTAYNNAVATVSTDFGNE